MDSEPPSPDPRPQPAVIAQDRTVAIVSYLTLIGFIVAALMHSSRKTELGAFHLRQTLGLLLTFFAVMICQFILAFIPVIGWICAFLLWVALLVLWVIGLIAAIKGEMKPIPVIGPLFQQWFSHIFE